MGRQKRPQRNGWNRGGVRKNALHSRLSGTDLGATEAPSRASERVTCRGHGGNRKRRPSSPTSDKHPWPPRPPCPRQPSSQQPPRAPCRLTETPPGAEEARLRMRHGWKTGIGGRAPGRRAAQGARMRKAKSL